MGFDVRRIMRPKQKEERTGAARRGRDNARSGLTSSPSEGHSPLAFLNHWRERIEDARRSGSFADQAGQYASGQTTRDYICNTIGQTATLQCR